MKIKNKQNLHKFNHTMLHCAATSELCVKNKTLDSIEFSANELWLQLDQKELLSESKEFQVHRVTRQSAYTAIAASEPTSLVWDKRASFPSKRLNKFVRTKSFEMKSPRKNKNRWITEKNGDIWFAEHN